MATSGSTRPAVASAVEAYTSRYAPPKAPIPPGIAIQTILDQSTLPKLACEMPDTAVVPTSAMCTAADASAGATPTNNSSVVEETPYAIPSDPSTNCAPRPASANIMKVLIASPLCLLCVSCLLCLLFLCIN